MTSYEFTYPTRPLELVCISLIYVRPSVVFFFLGTLNIDNAKGNERGKERETLKMQSMLERCESILVTIVCLLFYVFN